MMVRHRTIWAAPAPLWPEARVASDTAARGATIRRPAILRFASDEFMDELALILERDPSQLANLRAIDENWRHPAPLVAPPEPLSGLGRRLRQERKLLPRPIDTQDAATLELRTLAAGMPTTPYRLYHPASGRFYLAAACLVCDTPGLPDHVLETGERAAFVVRRLFAKPGSAVAGPPNPISWAADWQEYAFHTREKVWHLVESPTPQPDEERLPLFPMNYIAEDGRRRRLLAGLVPVARRDAYMSAQRSTAPSSSPLPGSPPDDSRIMLLHNDLIQPYQAILSVRARVPALAAIMDADKADKDAVRAKLSMDAEDNARLVSWYALLDFGTFLLDYLPWVAKQIGLPFPPNHPDNPLPPTGAEKIAADALLAKLGTVKDGTDLNGIPLTISVSEALKKIEDSRKKLEETIKTYSRSNQANLPKPEDWPDFVFNLDADGLQSLFTPAGIDGRLPLEKLVSDALPAQPLRLPESVLAKPAPDAGSTGWFLIRFVYDRPNCGPMRPPELSAPSLAFELASFYEPDAPARPIRIMLPIDSSPGGLRKYTKNTALMLSDQLACQKERLGGMTLGDLVLSVLPWPFHKDLPSGATDCDAGNGGIGLICSLSIPIITICALLLLMIIVNLLDIIFHWVPFFIMCFPLPGFKGKKS
jgi:hypothetical protein